METASIMETIVDLKQKEPFVPFKIVLTSGDGYVIESPGSLAIGKLTLHYYSPKTDGGIHMRTNQIVAVEEDVLSE